MDVQTKKPIRSNPQTVYTGVAAEDIAKDSVILQVICPELIPHTAFGTVAAGITQASINLKDRDGNAVTSQFTSANHLVATWEGESNLRYPPMIRKGEPVEIYKNSNQDKYYWRSTGRGRDFRTTDRVHIEIGATDPTKPGVVKDDTNTWSMWMDSDAKTLGVKTSKANNEVAAMSMQADLAQGTLHISDDADDPGNRIFLDTGAKSGTPIFQVNLKTGTTIKLEGDNMFVKLPGMLQFEAADRIVFNSPITVFNIDQTGTLIFNAANIAFNTAKDIILTAGNVIGLNSVSTKVTGVLIAAALRAANAVKSSAGSNYAPVTIQRPQETPVSTASNAADTDMSGLPYKTT